MVITTSDVSESESDKQLFSIFADLRYGMRQRGSLSDVNI